MTKNGTILTAPLVLLIAFFLTGCDLIFRNFVSGQPKPISGAIEIGTEWKEIIPPEPLRAVKSIQYVSLKMPDSVWRGATWDESDSKRQTLKYADGKTGRIELVLIDDKGESYELQINSKGGGFNLGRNPKETAGKNSDFPSDRLFTKLKIRSDVPLKLERIEWGGYNPK